MSWASIKKNPSAWPVQPNMPDLERACATFSWGKVRSELGGSADCFNIGQLAVDRHAAGLLCDRVALRWLGRDGTILDTTYTQLRDQTNRFANMLRWLEVGKEDRVFALAGRASMGMSSG